MCLQFYYWNSSLLRRCVENIIWFNWYDLLLIIFAGVKPIIKLYSSWMCWWGGFRAGQKNTPRSSYYGQIWAGGQGSQWSDSTRASNTNIIETFSPMHSSHQLVDIIMNRIKLSISAACFITWYIVDKLCYIDLLELLHPCLRIRGLTRAQILVYKICIFKSKSVPFSSSSSKASRNSKWTGF